MDNAALNVVVVGPGLDGTDVGESYSTFQLVEALSRQVNLTVLSNERVGRTPIAQQLPQANVVTWPEPAFLKRHFERFNALAQPAVPFLFAKARRWIARAAKAGQHFDIGHQIAPQGMRYVAPFRGLDLPYVIGPLGGGLSTPEGFRGEMAGGSMVTRLRGLDAWRLRHDPWLRAGYKNADLILGVAPYIGEALQAQLPVKRFEVTLERAYGNLEAEVTRPKTPGSLKLLHVGRTIRTKGLRDLIRAMAQLSDLPGVTLTVAGDGEDMPQCKAEAAALGVSDQITFLGKIPRDDVEKLYATSDVFAFPSFREPMGGVMFEALSWGLPILTAARGGPDQIVDDSCGIKIQVTEPVQYAADIAAAIRQLHDNPDLRTQLETGARARLRSFGTWDEKAAHLVNLYRQVLSAQSPPAA